MPRGRPGTRQQREDAPDFDFKPRTRMWWQRPDRPMDALVADLSNPEAFFDLAALDRIDAFMREHIKPIDTFDIGELLGRNWAKQQDWVGPSMEFDDGGYRFGRP